MHCCLLIWDGLLVNSYVISQVYIGGVHGDLCETYVVGSVDEQAHRLIESCRRCLDAAINVCNPGTRFSWIGNTIRYVMQPSCWNIRTFLMFYWLLKGY